MNRRAAIAATSLALSLSVGACAEEGAAPAPGGLELRMAEIGTCKGTENGDRKFPTGSDRVVLELSGGDLAEPWVGVAAKDAATAAAEVVLSQVPPGTGMTLKVVACSGASTAWAGETHGVDVIAHAKTFPPVFLTPTGAMSCTGTPSSARVFAALAADDERAWLLGGFSSYSVTEGAVATDSVDRYVRIDGAFASAGTLKAKRGFAQAQVLADGRVRVFGGAAKVRVAQAGKPALYASAADAPASASEIFDPAKGTSEVEEAVKLPALPSVAVAGEVGIAVGGVESGLTAGSEQYSKVVARFTPNGSDRAELPGAARFGATVVPLDERVALVWGGNVDALPANVGLLVETSGALDGAITELAVTGAAAVPLFASGALVGKDAAGRFQVLVAGGNVINAGPAFPRDVAAARLDLVVVDVAAGTAAVTAVALDALAPDFTRAAGSLYGLGGGEFLWFGGYTAFQSNPICSGSNDCLQTGVLRFKVTGLTGTPGAVGLDPELELSVGPLGARAVPLGDGSWLMTGGVETITQTTLDDAAALVRYSGFDRDLCAELPLPDATTP